MNRRTRIIRIQNFCFIAGSVFLFVFGSILIFILHEQSVHGEINKKLLKKNEMGFVLLERPQRKRFFSQSHYYYSYSGLYGGKAFSRMEKVDPDYFHISSPGKNVEIRIYSDPSGNLHSLLRGNTIPYGRDYSGLNIFSEVFFILGICFLFTGISMRVYTGSYG